MEANTNLKEFQLTAAIFYQKTSEIIDRNVEWYEVVEDDLDRRFGEQFSQLEGICNRIKVRGNLPEEYQSLFERFYNTLLQFRSILDEYENNYQTDKMTLSIIGEFLSATDNAIKNLEEESRSTRHKSYWWIQSKFLMDRLSPGMVIPFNTHSGDSKSRIYRNFFEVKKGEYVLLYEPAPGQAIKALAIIEKSAVNEVRDEIRIRVITVFPKPVYRKELVNLSPFQNSVIAKNNQGTLFEITQELFQVVLSAAGIPYPEVGSTRIENELQRVKLSNDLASYQDDLLDFKKDTDAFATLIATKDTQPPLAIALFGRWGSGKSFFMNRLRITISDLSINQGFPSKQKLKDYKPPTEHIFCSGIVQIEFNAWSYLDTNLWAGLVSTIFERLDKYIENKDNVESKEVAEVKSKLSEKLQIISNKKMAVLKEKTDLEGKLSEIRNKLTEATNNQEQLLKDIRDTSLEEIKKAAVDKIAPLADPVKEKLKEFGITPEKIAQLSPEALYDEVRSWVTFWLNLLKFKPRDSFILGFGLLILLLIIIDPYDFLQNNLQTIGRGALMILSVIGPIIQKAVSTFAKYKDVFSPVLQFKNDFNEKIQSAEAELNNKMAILHAELAQKDSHLAEIKNNLELLQKESTDLEYALNHSVTKQAFFHFINKRTQDGVYEKHLGLVSTIRKDFQTLSDLFIGANQQNEENKKTNEASKEFRKLFIKPLDRIILYIDDLDRCSDQKVIEVLEAVHLLMAYRLFIVVVGVDKRSVHNALIQRGMQQYGRPADWYSDIHDGTLKINPIAPSEYLEKIFQIPFHIEEPGEQDVQYMIHELLKDQIAEESIVTTGTTIHVGEHIIGAGNPIAYLNSGKINESEDGNESPIYKAPDKLKLSAKEFDYIKRISVFVGTTPRTIKRFINIYRLLRAHEMLTFRQDLRDQTSLIILFLLSLYTGRFSMHAKEFSDYSETKNDQDLDAFLTSKNLNEIKKIIINDNVLDELLSISISEYAVHLPLVKRFSF